MAKGVAYRGRLKGRGQSTDKQEQASVCVFVCAVYFSTPPGYTWKRWRNKARNEIGISTAQETRGGAPARPSFRLGHTPMNHPGPGLP